MFVHRNAALSLVKRRELVCFVSSGSTLKAAAAVFGVGERTAGKWFRRWLSHGEQGLLDRSSRPLTSPARTPEEVRARIVELRRERRCMRLIAQEAGVSVATVSRLLKRAGLSRLRDLDPAEPDNRYEHDHPGDLLHLDVKRIGRFDAPGHRATGDRAGRSRGAGYDYLFVAVDDHSRLAMVGIYPDERKHSAADFIDRVLERMEQLQAPVRRVLTDNGKCFSSELARSVYRRRGARHNTTRPYRPRTNGKAERFIQTLLREWAYAKTYADSVERNRQLGAYLEWYNHSREHSAIRTAPIRRLHNVLRNDI